MSRWSLNIFTRYPRTFRLTVWVLAALLLLILLLWLTVTVLGRTTLTVQSSRGEITSETTLGHLECRKTLKMAFPFVALRCQDQGAALDTEPPPSALP